MLRHSPLALRCLKASLNADCDGQMGLLDLAGNATLLYYMSEEAKEGKTPSLKNALRIFPNSPDFRNLPLLRTMAPSSDNEGAPRNGTAGRESLRDLPEHENIVEHFYDPEDQGSREKPVREKTPFSLIGNLIFLLTIAILAAIAWLVYSSWCPQKTDDLPGFRQRENAPDIPRILKQAINRDASVSFSEEDINRYLASSIHPQQHGALAIFATNPAAGIRLHGGKERPDGTIGEGYMEIIIERYTGIDSRQTISLFLTPFQSLDPHNYMAVQTRFEFYNDETLPGGIHVGAPSAAFPFPRVT